jgi:hypothetical protein
MHVLEMFNKTYTKCEAKQNTLDRNRGDSTPKRSVNSLFPVGHCIKKVHHHHHNFFYRLQTLVALFFLKGDRIQVHNKEAGSTVIMNSYQY